MQTIKDKLLNYHHLAHMALLLVSFIVYNIGNTYHNENDKVLFPLFLFHALCAIIAFGNRYFLPKGERRGLNTITLLLFLISAYALNRMMLIFYENTPWFSVVLIITGINLLLFHYADVLPKRVRIGMGFILGVSVMAILYLTCYLLPVYPISIPGLLVLGVSIHSFIPALLLVHIWFLFREHIRPLRAAIWSMSAGILVCIVAALSFTIICNSEVRQLNRIYNRTSAEGVSALPPWVEAAKQMNGNWIEDRVLKSDFIYVLPRWGDFGMFDMPGRNFGDTRIHDPLYVVASLFVPKIIASQDERIKILEALFDARHEAQERLWSGEDLYTDYVNTKVRIWPKLHLAYTEKVITVVNPITSGWRAPAEAIYTFHLPEGCVVTSLSLWVNGKEEKGILTTKEKANEAYKDIVGVQRRDPSLVRWQEGNTVSVRVFPVEAEGSRQFKIGFTAPLKASDKELIYENIYFDGPSPKSAAEDGTIEFATKPVSPDLPSAYNGDGTVYKKEGSYKADWDVRIGNETFLPNTFSFNGKGYSIRPYVLQRSPVQTKAVYLDVNQSWSDRDLNEVLALTGTTPVFVWANDRMTEANSKTLKALQKQRFSLFPIYEITDPASALLITKSTAVSPSLNDLEDSPFKIRLSTYLSDPALPKIRLLDLGEQLSPYLKSLKEFRVFCYEKGGILLLKVLMDSKTFASDTESDTKVVIDQSNIEIEQKEDSVTTAGTPDHLMRLFAYNHILQKAGKGLINASAGQERLVAVAQEAYVVSPISSLIVLETQADYDKFNIKDADNSLKNASMKSNGAVPEPHEWALIILVLITFTYIKLRPRWNKVNA